MNKLMDIVQEIDNEFREQQEELCNKKLKRLHKAMKQNNIPMINGSETEYTASSEYIFAVAYLDNMGTGLWLANYYLNHKDIFDK